MEKVENFFALLEIQLGASRMLGARNFTNDQGHCHFSRACSRGGK